MLRYRRVPRAFAAQLASHHTEIRNLDAQRSEPDFLVQLRQATGALGAADTRDRQVRMELSFVASETDLRALGLERFVKRSQAS